MKKETTEENKLALVKSPLGICLYALPTVFTMVFMALYMIIDGMFVAKYVNEYAFSALNMAYPVISAVVALGLMFAMGASAVLGKMLGEGKETQARSFLSQIYLVGIVVAGVISLITLCFTKEILLLLQTTELLMAHAEDYLRVYGYFFVFSMLQIFAQCFLVTAGKPTLGFVACFLGGLTNIFLDYLFIARWQWGVSGAGYATGIGLAVPSIFALIYFFCAKNNPLRFGKITWHPRDLGQACHNGMSELVTNLSVSITTLLFNVILLHYAGEAGVASITAILYIQMFQMGVYTGFSFGVAPLISFHYGAGNSGQLSKIIHISLWVTGISSLLVVGLSYLFADQALQIFIPSDSPTYAMAKEGVQLYTLAYCCMGFNVFLSSMFTALSNGKVSAILSCTRNFLFIVVFLIVLPQIFKLQGVWLAVPLAELCALVMGIYFYVKMKKIYGYGEKKS